MLYVYVAVTGAEIVIPDGESIDELEGDDEIRVLDASKRVLAVFQRRDITVYSRGRLPRENLPPLTEPK